MFFLDHGGKAARPVSGNPHESPRPLAMRSQDDRGPAYAAAVERSEAAFAAVRGVLGDRPRLAGTAGELAERPITPVRDNAGREYDVLAPAVELGTFLLRGPDAQAPEDTEASGYYGHAIEALEMDGPGVSLAAVAALIEHIVGLVDGDNSPACYLPDESRVAGGIRAEARKLRLVAVRLAELGQAAAAEKDAADDNEAGQ